MYFRKCTQDDLALALARVNLEYENNLSLTEPTRRTGGIRLVATAGKIGCRWNHRMNKRLSAASWEAHRDFLRELFEIKPKASVRTRFAHYNGKEGFEEKFPATAYVNIGSQMEPCTMPDLTYEPEPPKGKLKRNVRKPFNDVVRTVRKDLMTRMHVGEWDNEGRDFLTPAECWQALEVIAKRIEQVNHRRQLAVRDMFPGADWIPTEDLAPLFQQRPKQTFGRERGWDDGWLDSARRFESTVAAARRYWMEEFENDDWYEQIGDNDGNEQDRQ